MPQGNIFFHSWTTVLYVKPNNPPSVCICLKGAPGLKVCSISNYKEILFLDGVVSSIMPPCQIPKSVYKGLRQTAVKTHFYSCIHSHFLHPTSTSLNNSSRKETRRFWPSGCFQVGSLVFRSLTSALSDSSAELSLPHSCLAGGQR